MTAMVPEHLVKRVPESVKRISRHINPRNKAALALASKLFIIEMSISNLNIDQS